MTEKRFKEIISIQKVVDNQTGIEYDCLIDDKLLDLINDLSEEKEELRYKYNEKSNEYIGLEEQVDELLKENKELKNLIKKVISERVVAYPLLQELCEDIENIDIDHLISDMLIIKAESVKDKKIFNYADYLEKQLLKIKNKQAVLEL